MRDPKKTRELFGDRVEVRSGDLADISTALAGISDVFLLNSGPALEVRDRAAAFAAKAAADIADVAVKTLTTRVHDGEELVITGPQALTYGEMASRTGAVIGKPIRFEQISDEQARPNFDRADADALIDIWRAIREGRLATVTDGVQRILGRKPSPSINGWKKTPEPSGVPARLEASEGSLYGILPHRCG